MRSFAFISIFAIALPISACRTVGDFADDVGSHMPVIGDRCEHWQCFTEEGKQRSAMNRAARAQSAQASQPQPAMPETENPPLSPDEAQ